MTSKRPETYAEAATRLLNALARLGWVTKPKLTAPYAMHSLLHYRIYFYSQSTYLDGHSLFIDRRGLSVENLLDHVEHARKTRKF